MNLIRFVYLFIMILMFSACFYSDKSKIENNPFIDKIMEDITIYNKKNISNTFIGNGIYIFIDLDIKNTDYSGWYYYSIENLFDLNTDKIKELIYLLNISINRGNVYFIFGDKAVNLSEYKSIEDTIQNGEEPFFVGEEYITKIDNYNNLNIKVIETGNNIKPYIIDLPSLTTGGIIINFNNDISENTIFSFYSESERIQSSDVIIIDENTAKIDIELKYTIYKISSEDVYFGKYNFINNNKIIINGNYDEGSELRITSNDSNIKFGKGPTILYRETCMDITSGSTVRVIPEIGFAEINANKNGLPLVDDVAILPYGKGIIFGTENLDNNSVTYRMASVVSPEIYSEFFEQQYIYIPEKNQKNGQKIIDEMEAQGIKSTWQSKPLWNMYTKNGHSGYQMAGAMDIFTGFLNWYSLGKKWNSGYVITANATPVSTTFREGTGFIQSGEIVTNPILSQTWIKAGPIAGSGEGSDGKYFTADTIKGKLAEYSLKGKTFTSSVASEIGWDRFNYPGYVRGFPRVANAHFYYSDIYKAIGSNCRARVEIVDNEIYSEIKKSAIADVISWNENEVIVKIRKSIFYNESLNGKYIFLTKGNGEQINLGVIKK